MLNMKSHENRIHKDKKNYRAYLEWADKMFDKKVKPNSAEGELLQVILILIKDYEDKHYVINVPNPIEAIKYRMEQQGLSNKDLAQILGFKSRVSDIFKNTRKLNLSMIRKLYSELHIPLETLVKEY